MTTSVPASPEKKIFPVLVPSGHRGSERGPLPSTPNQHPYAIKTTSTALLTRSNSTGFSASPKHVYIPNTSSPSSSKHRHSKSDLAYSSPRPLPTPPAQTSPVKSRIGHSHARSDGTIFPNLRTRAETLPISSAPPPSSPVKVEDLPSNPRVWTTSQLSSYLITALRVRSGESLPLPLPVAKDIAGFVKEARLNGRAFLRLNEQDLETMGVNNLWREALLNASRNLRQNVLKGRIWGFEEDDNNSTRFPYTHAFSSSSSSVDDVSGSQDITPSKNSNCKGRVRGLVASLERTSSSGLSNHGSSTSEGELLTNAWADEEAAFASGSEASEIEDRKARATVKKRILPEPPCTTSPIPIPVMEALPEILGLDEIVRNDEEPSVEELLASSTDSLSHSWGAKAWEDLNIAETVKRINPENDTALESPISPSPLSCNSRTGSGKGSNKSTGESRRRIKDIFSRPLPSRPLPTPPMSASSSPGGLKLTLGTPLQIVEKVDECTQIDINELGQDTIQTGVDSAKKKLETEENEKLQTALSLLEIFKERLDVVEKKLEVLERKDAEQVIRDQYCQDIVKRNSVTESRSMLAECMGATKPSTILVEATSTQTNEASGPSKKLPPSIAENSTNNNCDELTPVSNKSEWRNYIPDAWDPLENGVPSYVFMVGVGVCAVVLTTLLNRIVGKKT